MDGASPLRTHYEALGLARDAEQAVVKAAFQALAKRYHPDSGGAVDDARMKEINAAWEVLSDPTRRAVYDAELAAREARAMAEGLAADDAEPTLGREGWGDDVVVDDVVGESGRDHGREGWGEEVVDDSPGGPVATEWDGIGKADSIANRVGIIAGIAAVAGFGVVLLVNRSSSDSSPIGLTILKGIGFLLLVVVWVLGLIIWFVVIVPVLTFAGQDPLDLGRWSWLPLLIPVVLVVVYMAVAIAGRNR